MNYVKSDFGNMNGIWDDIVGVATGEKSITSVISNLAYDEAMKQVAKSADIVKGFANKAVSAANAVSAQIQKISLAMDQAAADAALAEAKRQEKIAKNEAANATKNYAATQAAMKLLLGIKGLPQAVITSANSILETAKKSLDNANNASTKATQSLAMVQNAYNQKHGTFFSNLTSQLPSGYGQYLLIGGAVVAVSILGMVAYKLIKTKKGSKNDVIMQAA